MLNLSEIFFSIQGESSYTGLPCIFIRLAGCNLRCKYCDTKYSYKTRFQNTPNQIIESIRSFLPVKLVEITGGEPLLQDEIYELITLLHESHYKILLETNGSINMKKVPGYVTKIIDIKCPSSGFKDSFDEKNLNFLSQNKDEIKFVISDKNDYDWSKEKIDILNLNKYRILFSPVFSILNSQDLAEWIIKDKLNIRLQLQLHKYIWDSERSGV
jgi:7-carboxy-7-deazaguanine synthase